LEAHHIRLATLLNHKASGCSGGATGVSFWRAALVSRDGELGAFAL
jgi:hypothetical protein